MFKSLPLNRQAEATIDLYFGDILVAGFTGRYADTRSTSVKLALERRNRRLSAKELQRIRNPKSEEDIAFRDALNIDFFLDQEVLTGWQIEGEDGKPVPFTRENVRAFLTHPEYRWVFPELDAFFTDESNFTDKPLAEAVGE